jgi:hypothetical protein
MSYSFNLARVHMYVHSLTYHDEAGSSWATAEDSPDPAIGLVVWPDQWSDHPKGIEYVSARFREWADQRGIKFKFAEKPR